MIPIARVISACATYYGVRVDEIKSPSRLAHHVRARHAAMYLAHLRGHSYAALGMAFGRDHTSVVAAYRKFCRDHADDEDLAALDAALDAPVPQDYRIEIRAISRMLRDALARLDALGG